MVRTVLARFHNLRGTNLGQQTIFYKKAFAKSQNAVIATHTNETVNCTLCPVWPDWAIFAFARFYKFYCKSSPNFGDFWKMSWFMENCSIKFFGGFCQKLGYFQIQPSGHTGSAWQVQQQCDQIRQNFDLEKCNILWQFLESWFHIQRNHLLLNLQLVFM